MEPNLTPENQPNQPPAPGTESSAAQPQPQQPSVPVETYTPTVIQPTAPATASADPATPAEPAQPTVSGPFVTPASAPAAQPIASPPEPVAYSPVVSGQPPVAPPNGAGFSSSAGEPGKKRRWLLPTALVAVLVLLLGGGFVFGYYLPNQPSAVYGTSLKRTGMAVDKLVSYSKSSSKKNYNSYNLDGTVSVKTADGSFDTTLKGALDKDANGTLAVDANVLGEKLSVNIKSVHAGGNTTPDVYLQASGIKQYLDGYGLSQFDSLDGQWISIDHTLLDTVAANLQQTGGSATSTTPTADQVNDALVKAQTVNKQYLFSTDNDKAVLKDHKYIGKETQDGRSVYHYTIGYDKAHLQAYVSAMKTALDSSSLNDWSKKSSGKSLSDSLDLSMLTNFIKDANANYRFDLYADTKTKLVDRLQFADPSDKTSTFFIGQTYTGGDTYPFVLGVNAKADNGSTKLSTLKVSVDSKTDIVKAAIDAVGDDNGSTTITGSFTLTPSQQKVTVTAPPTSTPVMQILNQLGLGGLSDSSSDPLDSSAVSNLLTFTQ